MADSYGIPPRRGNREIARNFVVKRELAIFRQHENRGRRELLPDGTQLENGVRRDRNVQLDIGKAVALRFYEAAVADNSKRQARNVLLANLRSDVGIYAGGAELGLSAGNREHGGSDH